MLAPRGLLQSGEMYSWILGEFFGLVLWLGVGIAHKGSNTNPLAQVTLIIYAAGLPGWWLGRGPCMKRRNYL